MSNISGLIGRLEKLQEKYSELESGPKGERDKFYLVRVLQEIHRDLDRGIADEMTAKVLQDDLISKAKRAKCSSKEWLHELGASTEG